MRRPFDETTDTFLYCQLVPNQGVISPKQGSHEVQILGLGMSLIQTMRVICYAKRVFSTFAV